MGNLTKKCFESLWKLRKRVEELEGFASGAERIIISGERIERLETPVKAIESLLKEIEKSYDEVKDCNFKAKFETVVFDRDTCKCFTPEKKVKEELDLDISSIKQAATNFLIDPTVMESVEDLIIKASVFKDAIDGILLGCNCLNGERWCRARR